MHLSPLRLEAAWDFGGLTLKQAAVRTWRKMNEHEIFTRAAAVSFYAMLALVPFLAIFITITAKLLPDLSGFTGEHGVGDMTRNEFQATLASILPGPAAKLIADQMAQIQKQPPVGLLSIGLLVSIWTASSLFLAIIDALNRIYGVTETRPWWKLRLTAIGMTLLQAVILIGSLIVIAAWPLILQRLGLSQPAAVLATLVQWVVISVMVLLSFALTFYVGPDAQQRWEWISPGSLIGTIAFVAASGLFGLYVRSFNAYGETYGSLGGVLALLFWFWVSAVVLLTAGQLNKVIEDASPLGKKEGQKVDPSLGLRLENVPPRILATDGHPSHDQQPASSAAGQDGRKTAAAPAVGRAVGSAVTGTPARDFYYAARSTVALEQVCEALRRELGLNAFHIENHPTWRDARADGPGMTVRITWAEDSVVSADGTPDADPGVNYQVIVTAPTEPPRLRERLETILRAPVVRSGEFAHPEPTR